MARGLQKEKWTITFNHELKNRVRKEARKLRIYPVQLLESLVREKLNPYGFQSIHDSIAYVNSVREESTTKTDATLLAELKKWQKS